MGVPIGGAHDRITQKSAGRWGILFQQGALYSALTVFENIAQPMRELRVLPQDLIRDAVLLKMNMVDLGPDGAEPARERTILISSHILSDLERVVSHVAFISDGLVQDTTACQAAFSL
eukprot:gene3602-4265_t